MKLETLAEAIADEIKDMLCSRWVGMIGSSCSFTCTSS
jgi:hypothetical protein